MIVWCPSAFHATFQSVYILIPMFLHSGLHNHLCNGWNYVYGWNCRFAVTRCSSNSGCWFPPQLQALSGWCFGTDIFIFPYFPIQLKIQLTYLTWMMTGDTPIRNLHILGISFAQPTNRCWSPTWDPGEDVSAKNVTIQCLQVKRSPVSGWCGWVLIAIE